MNSNRIREIQQSTAYPDSQSVQWALLQVWNECGQEYEAENKQLQQQINQLNLDKTMLQEKHDFEKAGLQLEIDKLKVEIQKLQQIPSGDCREFRPDYLNSRVTCLVCGKTRFEHPIP
jgi:hypothetical protein